MNGLKFKYKNENIKMKNIEKYGSYVLDLYYY